MNRDLTVNRARIERDAYPYLRSTLNCTRNRYAMEVSGIAPNQGYSLHCPVMPMQLSGPISWKAGIRRLKDYFSTWPSNIYWEVRTNWMIAVARIIPDPKHRAKL